MKSFIISIMFMIFPNIIFALTNSIPALSDSLIHIVQIRNDAPGEDGEAVPGFCNGTLISKNVLITAAHCLKEAYITGQSELQITLGQYKYVNRKPDGKLVRVGYAPKKVFTKKGNIELPTSLVDKLARNRFKTKISPAEDFAIYWWTEETPELDGIMFADFISPAEHNMVIKNLSAYQLNVTSVNLLAEKSLDTKRTATLNDFKWTFTNYIQSKSFSRVEEGDSGAPLFINLSGKNKVFGVVKGKATTVFDNWDAFASIHPHLCFLDKKLPTHVKLSACK